MCDTEEDGTSRPDDVAARQSSRQHDEGSFASLHMDDSHILAPDPDPEPRIVPAVGGPTAFALSESTPKVEPSETFSAARKRAAEKKTDQDSSGLHWSLEILLILVGAVILAVILRMFVVQVYQIPSASMEETLHNGSRIAVNRLPVIGKQIERGDVIVFSDQEQWLTATDVEDRDFLREVGEFLGIVPADGKQVLVKRVIGLPGDSVECCDAEGRLSVNGVVVDEPYVVTTDVAAPSEFSVMVPEGRVWVMGDNRLNSADSLYHYNRGEQGFVSTDAIIGKAFWEIWPISDWSGLGDRSVFSQVPQQ